MTPLTYKYKKYYFDSINYRIMNDRASSVEEDVYGKPGAVGGENEEWL